MLKKLIGIAPTEVDHGVYKPSPLSLKLATSSTTNYSHTNYQEPYQGNQYKILMVCTEENHLKMANGKKFLTGNHPVEMLVPMLHFEKAGFKTEIYTPTGQSAEIEKWAMPEKDKAVKNLYSKSEVKFNKPKNLKKFVKNEMDGNEEIIGIFIPGGHGALLGLPENDDLKKLIHWAFEKELLILSICHGPAALLAADIDDDQKDFIFKGYAIAAFPDAVDDKTPLIGYLPGNVPWKFGEKLKKLGVNIVNKKADGTCHKDRNLITGASPAAANDFGELGAKELLRRVKMYSKN